MLLKIELKANFSTGWINFSDILVTKADGVVTKYYFAGAQRVAMRKNGSLSFLLSDHLGSTSITTDAAGTKTSELRYSPWGEVRFSSSANPGLPTDYTFTGQYSYMDDPTTDNVSEGFGLTRAPQGYVLQCPLACPVGTTPPWDASPRRTP